MDPLAKDQLDYGDEEHGKKMQYKGGGAIYALDEEEMIADDNEYDDLYNDVNVGEGFLQLQRTETVPLGVVGNGEAQVQKAGGTGLRVHDHDAGPDVAIPGVLLEGKDSNIGAGFPENNSKGGFVTGKGLEEGGGAFQEGIAQQGRFPGTPIDAQVGNTGLQGAVPVPPNAKGFPSQLYFQLLRAVHALWSEPVTQTLPGELKAVVSMSDVEQAILRGEVNLKASKGL